MYTSTLLRFHHRSPATARTSITPPALPPPSESTTIITSAAAAAAAATTARCIAGLRLICITAKRLAQHPLHSRLPQPSSALVMTTEDGHRDGQSIEGTLTNPKTVRPTYQQCDCPHTPLPSPPPPQPSYISGKLRSGVLPITHQTGHSSRRDFKSPPIAYPLGVLLGLTQLHHPMINPTFIITSSPLCQSFAPTDT
nr:unnamed protein product [Spirometra erinaceieuropaei]